MNDDFLTEAIGLLDLADGREGPEDARHAAQLVIARALVVIAQELRQMNTRGDAEQAYQDYLRDRPAAR
jgi:hypothetical protein